MKNKLFQKHEKLLPSLILALVLIFTAFIYFIICKPLLAFTSDPVALKSFVESKGFVAQILFAAMVFLQTLIAPIPGEALEIAAGYAFGAIEGTILCITAMTVASMIVFMLVRTFGIKLARFFFKQHTLDKLRFLKNNKNRYVLFAIIFAIPGTPKDLFCYFAGLTDINPWIWLLICSVGRLPSIITSTLGGEALSDKSYLLAIWVFLGAVVISTGGLLIYKLICKIHRKN